MSTAEKPSLNFETPKCNYDELEQQLKDFLPDPDRYPHDVPSVISIAEAIRAGRMGNVAVGGCLLHHDQVILRDVVDQTGHAFAAIRWIQKDTFGAC